MLFLKEMPWGSQWSAQADDVKVLQKLAEHFSETQVHKNSHFVGFNESSFFN
jgi:hypothetical protein